MTELTAADVAHNPDHLRYELIIDGHLAELTYVHDGDKVVWEHTRVPDELGGRGIAGLLVQAAVDDAVANGLTVVPQCPYASSWLGKHPDQAERLSIASR